MNTLKGKIIAIDFFDGLTRIRCVVGENILTAIVTEDVKNNEFLTVNNTVELNFKETEIIITTHIDAKTSAENCLKCTLGEIKHGNLFSHITLNYFNAQLDVVVSKSSVDFDDLHLHRNKINLLLRATDIILSPC